MRYGLTQRQYNLFCFIHDYIEEHHIPPSQDEMAKGLLIKNGQALHNNIEDLQKRGWIDWIPNCARTIVILPDTTEYFSNQYNPWLVYDEVEET